MKNDFYNQPPSGYVRSSSGFLRINKTPQTKKLKKENDELRERLDQLEAIVSELTAKKGKK